MTRAELEIALSYAIEQRWLSREEANELLVRYDAGDLGLEDLPFPLLELQATAEPTDRSTALLVSLGLTGLLTLERRGVSVGGILQRVLAPAAYRARLRDTLRREFETGVVGLARSYTGGQISLRDWSGSMARGVSNYMVGQAQAAAGRTLTGNELGYLRGSVQQQLNYLYRYTVEGAIRQGVGRPFSEGYMANRSRQYGGAGWGEWFKFEELGHTPKEDGWVVEYIARDDGSTCGFCSQAAARGPYLPGQGPMPGQVCRGHGSCRCIRRPVRNVALARDLALVPV